MSNDLLINSLRGSIFGAALVAAGVYAPQIIIDQLSFKEYHMMKVYFTASAASALVLATLKDKYHCKPRPAANLGRLGPYDGNVIGGLLCGAGMALTGACPGTVFAQLGARVPSAVPVFVGTAVGGILYVRFKDYLSTDAAKAEKQDQNNLTVPTRFKIDPNVSLLALEALLLSALFSLDGLQKSPSYIMNPVLGGLVIGVAQFASVVLSATPLGVSTAFEEIGKWFWYLVDKAKAGSKTPKPPSTTIQLATGIVIGSYLLTKLRPEFVLSNDRNIHPAVGFLGGVLLAVGPRIAGGCTSGHGISGMAMLSVSSVIAVMSMFGGGMGLGALLHR